MLWSWSELVLFKDKEVLELDMYICHRIYGQTLHLYLWVMGKSGTHLSNAAGHSGLYNTKLYSPLTDTPTQCPRTSRRSLQYVQYTRSQVCRMISCNEVHYVDLHGSVLEIHNLATLIKLLIRLSRYKSMHGMQLVASFTFDAFLSSPRMGKVSIVHQKYLLVTDQQIQFNMHTIY
ncbi:16768_t:CDS:2 [Funneliformis mosseae]|uniref:16768_t:CDS:1 n=1 Tax=Funneliformis mosseae TaxID=27381 RepID=A0A9N8V585_FUNMO|nr:16768_t:CDS:2 [Funneliformis mosseae]